MAARRTRTLEKLPDLGVRQQRAEETRAALVEAGTALFAEQGLDGPSLDAICERAGRTRGAFYVHFEGRDEFLVAVMDRVGSEFLDHVFAPPAPGEATDLASTVARFVTAASRGRYPLTKKGGVKPHQLLEACARSPRIRARYVELVRESIARLASAVATSQRERLLRSDVDAEQVAAILLAGVIGAQTMIELRVPVDLAGTAAVLLTMLSPVS